MARSNKALGRSRSESRNRDNSHVAQQRLCCSARPLLSLKLASTRPEFSNQHCIMLPKGPIARAEDLLLSLHQLESGPDPTVDILRLVSLACNVVTFVRLIHTAPPPIY